MDKQVPKSKDSKRDVTRHAQGILLTSAQPSMDVWKRNHTTIVISNGI